MAADFLGVSLAPILSTLNGLRFLKNSLTVRPRTNSIASHGCSSSASDASTSEAMYGPWTRCGVSPSHGRMFPDLVPADEIRDHLYSDLLTVGVDAVVGVPHAAEAEVPMQGDAATDPLGIRPVQRLHAHPPLRH